MRFAPVTVNGRVSGWMLGAVAVAAAHAGCSGGDGSTTNTDTDTTTTDPTETTPIDTSWPPGDVAYMQIAHHVNSGTTDVYAVFAESDLQFENGAQCAVEGTVCVAGFPRDDDDYLDVDPDQEVDQETMVTRFAGYEVGFGPYTLPYREDPDTKFGYYYLAGGSEDLPEGWIGETWGGQWPAWESDHDLYVPPPLELTQPAINDHITFTNGEKVPLEWVPTGEGFVTLSVATRFSLSRIYKLEDDGYFELDADSLGLTSDTEDVTFQFTRWSTSKLNPYGHVVNLVSTSDAYFTGQFIQIGTRSETQVADECAEAEGQVPLAPGGWWGFLGGQVDGDLNPTNCLTGPYTKSAAGRDGLFRLEVPPRHSIGIDYNTFDESASVYFMSDCNSDTFCIIGRDESPDPNIHEFLNYFNSDDQPRTLFLGVDASALGTSVFTLDYTDEELGPPDMYDSCAEAQGAPVTTTTANYYADFVAYTDSLNPGAGGCTGTSLPGNDSMTPITLLGGQTLSVTISMPGGDPAVYLVYNCADAFSCPVGADASIGTTEQLVYQNTGAGAENMYLVVDSKSGLTPYFLGVTIY
ncbi:MAG: hypothetical protein ABMB14_15300 [Myxococcota bacterium]